MTIFTNRQILGIKCEKFTADNHGENNRKTSNSLNEWDSYPEFLSLSYAIEICSSMCSFASPIACTVHRPSVEFSKKKRKTSEDRLRTDIFQKNSRWVPKKDLISLKLLRMDCVDILTGL